MKSLTQNNINALIAAYLDERKDLNPTHIFVNQYGQETLVELKQYVIGPNGKELALFISSYAAHVNPKELFEEWSIEIRKPDVSQLTTISPLNGQIEFAF